jgi:hypothetical protein
MCHRTLLLTTLALLFAFRAAPQEQDAMVRWGEVTLDKLEPFLPDPSPLGFSPELPGRPSDFKAWANDTVKLYPALLVHKNWYLPDPKLFRDIEESERDKATFKKEEDAELENFQRTHGEEMKAQQNAYSAQRDALSKRAQALIQQGKYQEAGELMGTLKPFQYPPFDSLMNSLRKRGQELEDREKDLLGQRRSVSFRIYTNRTPTTTAFANPSTPVGTLAGHALYRQERGIMSMGGNNKGAFVNFAIFVGPANFQNAQVKLDERKPQVKCIVIWAWIQSRPDTIQADEAAVKKVLATIDYEGLSKLIEP